MHIKLKDIKKVSVTYERRYSDNILQLHEEN